MTTRTQVGVKGDTPIIEVRDDSGALLYTSYEQPPGSAIFTVAALQDKATAALTANGTFLAIASPTNAQAVTQVQALTRECSAIIRLLLNLTDTTAGT